MSIITRMKRKFLYFLSDINFRKKMFKLFKFEENYCDYEDRFSVHVRFTDVCPNKCKWCLDQKCVKGNKKASGKEMAKMTNFLKRKMVQVSGGEPLIDMNRIYEFFQNLDEGPKININTYLPKTAYDNQDKLFEIFDKCNMIEISCQGTCNEEDEAVYGTKLGYDKYAFIKELAKRYSDKIHINCVLDRNKIATMHDIEDFFKFFYSFGIKNFYIKEMGKTPPGSYEEYISINEILKNSNMKQLRSAYCYGCRPDVSYLFEKDFPGIYVRLKRWCQFEGGEKLTLLDKFKFWLNYNFLSKRALIILNENGAYSDWFVKR